MKDDHIPNPSEASTLGHAEQQSVYRILDASANRCREGLRVVEEYVRFHQENEVCVKELKSIRHLFSQICLQLDLEQAMQARNTAGDVGTKISLPTELSRKSLDNLVRANCSRVGESLRTLEEYSKLVMPEISAGIEKVRYQFYDVEKKLLSAGQLRSRLENASIYFLFTGKQCQGQGTEDENFEAVAKAAISAGVGVIQLREKELSDRKLLERARLLRRLTLDTETLYIVNDRPDVALLSDADGVHVGQEELLTEDVRSLIGENKLVGVSTHSIEQATEAVLSGANYLGVGPVFPSQTKEFTQFAGLELVKQVSKQISLPWFAIGGINESNIDSVVQAGASRIAVSQALCGTACLEEVVQKFGNSLSNSQ